MAERKKKVEKEKEPKKPRKRAVKPVEPPAVEQLPVIVHHQAAPRPKKEKAPKGPQYFATGRRKEAVARVRLRPGSGQVTINGRDYQEYLSRRKLLEFQLLRPLNATDNRNTFDVMARAAGGGVPGQAVAVSLGIARALIIFNPELRLKLKRLGLLRRDPRMKERKKYGLKRARRAFQYTKR
jgi:small subunit ribosomal protein S9